MFFIFIFKKVRMNNNKDNIEKEKRQLLRTFFLTLPSTKKLHMQYNVSSKNIIHQLLMIHEQQLQ